MRRRGAGIAASPTMVGALTVMVVILAVFLAYNANNGLPFVPAYRVTAQVRNADTLVPGNEVRVGGVRVGRSSRSSRAGGRRRQRERAAQPEARKGRRPDPGRLDADRALALGARAQVPRDQHGQLGQGLPGGQHDPALRRDAGAGRADTVLGMFDEPTRAGIQTNLVEFGDAVAGRGPSINSASGACRACSSCFSP
jgi:hypothetical protein